MTAGIQFDPEQIRALAQILRETDLSEIELEYMFLDGSHFKFHAGAKAEPVLVAWGIDVAGKPHLLHLVPGSSESTDAWAEFLRDMAARGLRPPLLIGVHPVRWTVDRLAIVASCSHLPSVNRSPPRGSETSAP